MSIPDAYSDFLGAINHDTWASDANCIGQAATLEGHDVRAAKSLCLGNILTGQPRCPVIDQCLQLTLSTPSKVDVDGICAGLTKPERDTARRRNATTTEKRCNKCRAAKPLTEYYAENRQPDGRRGICKTCTRADAKTRDQRKKVAA
jgi:hypothetical protein